MDKKWRTGGHDNPTPAGHYFAIYRLKLVEHSVLGCKTFVVGITNKVWRRGNVCTERLKGIFMPQRPIVNERKRHIDVFLHITVKIVQAQRLNKV